MNLRGQRVSGSIPQGLKPIEVAGVMSELPTRPGHVPLRPPKEGKKLGGERVDGGRRGVIDSRAVRGDQAWSQFHPSKKSEEAR